MNCLLRLHRVATLMALGLSLQAVACTNADTTLGFEETSRVVISLNGSWDAGEGGLSNEAPSQLTHQVPVPGLLTSASPPFEAVGIESDRRQAFWLQTSFTVSSDAAVTRLRIHKAKYGAKVWLNGVELGEQLGSYTMGEYDASTSVVVGAPNTLLVRLGAEVGAVPSTIPAGQDIEKERFIPGIYDDVELIQSGPLTIERVLIEPDPVAERAHVRTTVKNRSPQSWTVSVQQCALAHVTGAAAGGLVTTDVALEPGSVMTVEQDVPVNDVQLWSPGSPFLYDVETIVSADGVRSDDVMSRFGMRTVEWRAGADKGFYLNGQRTYLRGTNLSLHRFFEDEHCKNLPWDRQWVRDLLSTHPKALGWNSMRVSIGRLPQLWYDIADEEGILLADEFQWWSAFSPADADWSVDELERQFTSWIHESFNHPSIAWWDASNETRDERSTETIDRVRHLDPTRQWENGGYLAPHGSDDPIEDHNYLFMILEFSPQGPDDLTLIGEHDGMPTGKWTFEAPDHPYILNEYAWLWVNRDGTPTTMSRSIYEAWLGDDVNDPQAVREAYAYVTSELTAFWRAKRGYAGVQHFTYLGYSRPATGATSDNFIDVEALELEPRWESYAKSAWAPVAVYIDSWQQDYPAGTQIEIPVIVINDTHAEQPIAVEILAVDDDGAILSQSETTELTLAALGVERPMLNLAIPDAERYVLFARLRPESDEHPTVYSRRKIGYPHPGSAIGDPPAE